MKTQKAFTLVEMLIVITIIGIIAFLGVSSYGNAEKQAKLEFATDTVVSVIRQQQSLAKSGRISSTPSNEKSDKKCYGVIINNQAITTVQMQYFALKDNHADLCDIATMEEKPLEELKGFTITTLEKGGQKSEELLIVFKPPTGKVFLGTRTELFPPQSNSGEDVRIGVTAPQGNEEKLIQFSPATGFIERVKKEAPDMSKSVL